MDGPPSSPWPVLGARYEVRGVLGRGGMGEVRAGWDRRLQRPVALKLLRPDMAADPAVRARFEQEARMAARLVHPHVVAVFDSGEDGPVAYLVMEQLPGRTLRDDLVAGPLAPGAVVEVGRQVLDALAAAHAVGMVHRDIKPSNVLAAGTGRWKVGDFGIAKSIEAVDPELTSTGLIVGTPAYLAPERLAGGLATPAGDVYAVGVVLLQALTGSRDRSGTTQVAPWGPTRASGEGYGPAPGLMDVIRRATATDPSARWPGATAMAEALDAVDGAPRTGSSVGPIRGASTEATAGGVVGMGGPIRGGSGGEPTRMLPPPVDRAGVAPPVGLSSQLVADRRRRRAVGALAGLIALVAVAAIAVSLARHGSTGPSRTRTVSSTVPPATSVATTTVATTTVATTTVATTAPPTRAVATTAVPTTTPTTAPPKPKGPPAPTPGPAPSPPGKGHGGHGHGKGGA